MNTVKVCFSPKLLELDTLSNKIVVVVDILRATTIITTMFKNGLQKLIPVKELSEAKQLAAKGFIIAAERDGKKLDFADFDNSPYSFSAEKVSGKTLVYSTTNGTNTIHLVKDSASEITIGSFLNLSSLAHYIVNQKKDVLILCSGWQGDYCIEDALFAGALSKILLSESYISDCDSLKTSIALWQSAKDNLSAYIKNIYQYKRLVNLGLKNIIDYCFQIDTTQVIPVCIDDCIVAK
ncbi:MAG: 2-phosphosulfolactate phosphatase [Bacteroidales bacterium]|nr:2-phosphosulfolactate phosphatase [Bacteroidales bacterium]